MYTLRAARVLHNARKGVLHCIINHCEPLASLTYKPGKGDKTNSRLVKLLIETSHGEASSTQVLTRRREPPGHDEIKIGTPLKTAVTDRAAFRMVSPTPPVDSMSHFMIMLRRLQHRALNAQSCAYASLLATICRPSSALRAQIILSHYPQFRRCRSCTGG